jgi:glycosyltransferase involved in cell wall biosynthesis
MITIITINFNNSQGLGKTLASTSRQTFKDFQHVIIDGGSSDDSKQVIASYSHEHTVVVSERDDGIYHAMNKGISLSYGEYLLFLNSGDVLFSKDTIRRCSEFRHNGQDLIIGMAEFKSGGRKRRLIRVGSIGLAHFIQNSLPHSATLIRRDAFERFGFYDQKQKICADWKFFLIALYQFDATFVFIHETISVFDGSGISSQPENQAIIKEEKVMTLKELYGDRVAKALFEASNDRFMLQTRRHKLLMRVEEYRVFGGFLVMLLSGLHLVVLVCGLLEKALYSLNYERVQKGKEVEQD